MADTGTPATDTAGVPGQLRGSTLMLGGHVIALGLNFVSQVLVVRTLSKQGYGAFAYGLSIALLAQTVTLFGLDRGVQRFAPIYDEEGRPARVLGLLVVVVGAVLAIGLATVVIVAGLRGRITGSFDPGTEASTVLLVIIALAPVEALDRLLVNLFAVFARPMAIFLRKYVLAPGLRLAAVLALVAASAGPVFLAWGYVLAGAVGLAIYVPILLRVLRDRGVATRASARTIELPVREVLGFTLPLLTTDLVFSTMNSIDAIMVGQLSTGEEVAELRAVHPVARLNQVVIMAFSILYTPAASRLFARGETDELGRLYWRTALWIAVLTFPILAVTVPLATPVTELLFGTRYRDAGLVLAITSAGYFLHAALGFNGMTLNVFAAVRYQLGINVVAGGLNVALNLLLIPDHGAVGAAVATAVTLVVHNLGKQLGLRLRTTVPALGGGALRVYAILAAGLALLLVLVLVTGPSLWLGLPAAAAVSLAVLWLTRAHLRIADVFPELGQVPILRRLTGPS